MKNRLVARTVLSVAMLFASSVTYAAFWSGTKLIQHLEEDMRGDATYTVGLATGYIIGVVDTVEGVLACPPTSVTVKQVKQIVYNYMKANPDQWNQTADAVVTNALRSTWPCKK